MKLAVTLAVAFAVGYFVDGANGAGWCIVVVGGLWLMASLVDFRGL